MSESIEDMKNMEEVLKGVALAVDETLQHFFGDIGFIFLTFQFNAPGIANYVANAERATIIKALRETADRLEQKQDIPPALNGVH